jgi:hypothetical protein
MYEVSLLKLSIQNIIKRVLEKGRTIDTFW